MNNRFILVGEQTLAINHITGARRYGAIVNVSVVSGQEPIQLTGDEARAFWAWHTSALNTTTLPIPQESENSEPVAVS